MFTLSWLLGSWLGWVSVALVVDDLAKPQLWVSVGALLGLLQIGLLWQHLQPRWRLAWGGSTLLGFSLMGYLISLAGLWLSNDLLFLLIFVASSLPLGVAQQWVLNSAGYARRLWLPAQPLAILLALILAILLDNLLYQSLSLAERFVVFSVWGLAHGLVTSLAMTRMLFVQPAELDTTTVTG